MKGWEVALSNAQLNLQKSYTNFFAGRAKFPKFKSRKSKQTYTTNLVNGNIQLLDGYIKLPKLKQHREIPSHHIIKSCTISRTAREKYYISILAEYQHEPKPKEIHTIVGLDFAMKGMAQALRFGKSVSDNGWGMFMVFLHYKLAEQGKKLFKIDKWFPSTKTCSCCGHVKKIASAERAFSCECGFVSDRDWNAAINIKTEGRLMLTLS